MDIDQRVEKIIADECDGSVENCAEYKAIINMYVTMMTCKPCAIQAAKNRIKKKILESEQKDNPTPEPELPKATIQSIQQETGTLSIDSMVESIMTGGSPDGIPDYDRLRAMFVDESSRGRCVGCKLKRLKADIKNQLRSLLNQPR